MNKNKTGYWIILSLLLINITLLHGFTAIYPHGFSDPSGRISFWRNLSSNGMLFPVILGYGALIYVAIKLIDESIEK